MFPPFRTLFGLVVTYRVSISDYYLISITHIEVQMVKVRTLHVGVVSKLVWTLFNVQFFLCYFRKTSAQGGMMASPSGVLVVIWPVQGVWGSLLCPKRLTSFRTRMGFLSTYTEDLLLFYFVCELTEGRASDVVCYRCMVVVVEWSWSTELLGKMVNSAGYTGSSEVWQAGFKSSAVISLSTHLDLPKKIIMATCALERLWKVHVEDPSIKFVWECSVSLKDIKTLYVTFLPWFNSAPISLALQCLFIRNNLDMILITVRVPSK